MLRLATRAILVTLVLVRYDALPVTAQGLEAAAANDNRQPAGHLRNGELTLRLEVRKGVWHPERSHGEAIPVYAFAEFGKPLQIPGPLLRVTQGTTIAVSVHNTLAVPVTLHGLHQRPGRADDVATVAPATTTEIRFVAGEPGTYLYYGRTPDGRRGNQRLLDSLLGGALIVDPPQGPSDDRIFVLQRWNGATRTAINGKSWPYTERLTHTVGETVRWRIVNASDLSHPMHLHGFHYNLDGVGDGEKYHAYDREARPLVFTHSAQIGETFDMSWVPREPGRWLFHCHRFPHMRLPIALNEGDAAVLADHTHAHEDPAYAGMGGMILGITVNEARPRMERPWRAVRQLELIVNERTGSPGQFELTAHEAGELASKARGSVSAGLSGPPLVLTQHEPVEIAIVNRSTQATAIHWHGIELESYYDGVPGWGGIGTKKTPPINPGETFVARMVPGRAGTFMYHTHWHELAQLTGGVHGPFIVVPQGQTYDGAKDKSFIFSHSPAEPFGALLLMNGTPQPATMALRAGATYRFRFMNITPAVDNVQVSLREHGMPVQWRPVAKDAVDLPPASARMTAAEQQIAIGETFDFEYDAATPGVLTLEAIQPNNTRRVTLTLVFEEP